jgi:hypothetical protein
LKYKNNNNDNNDNNSTSIFKITFLIAIVAMILITLTLTLNSAAVVFAQTIDVNSSKSGNQSQGLQTLCKLPTQELARELHGMHLTGC